MRVILLKDIKNVGRQWDVKRISDGHARNYLLPNGLVKLATQDALDELEETMRQREMAAGKELKQFESLISELDGFELMISAKADEEGSLYSQVDAKAIAARLKELDFNVPSSTIKLSRPIKTVGEHKVMLEFDHGLEAEVKIIVEAKSSTKSK